MKQYINLFLNEKSDISFELHKIEKELEIARDENRKIYIRIRASSQLFELFIPQLIGFLEFYNSGIIDSYYVEKEKKNLIYNNIFDNCIEIKKPTTFLCNIEEEQTLIVFDSVTILGVLRGTVVFQNNNAVLIAKKMENAKVITCMGVFNGLNYVNKICKGDDNLWQM